MAIAEGAGGNASASIESRMLAHVRGGGETASSEGAPVKKAVEPREEPDNHDLDDEAEEQPEADGADGSEAGGEDAPESDDEEYAATTSEDSADNEPEEDELLEFVHPDGSTVRVTPQEYADGYLRMEDYTRKTQSIAEERRALQSQRQEWESRVRAEAEFLAEFSPPKPEDDPSDPIGSWERMRAWEKEQAKRNEFLANRQRQTAEAQRQTLAAEQARLLRALPEWRDPKVAAADRDQISSALIAHYRFRPEELNGIIDHRALLVALDAARYRASQKKTAEKVSAAKKKVSKAPPKPVKSEASAPPQKGPGPRMARLHKNLRRSGSVDDAAKLLMARGRRT